MLPDPGTQMKGKKILHNFKATVSVNELHKIFIVLNRIKLRSLVKFSKMLLF